MENAVAVWAMSSGRPSRPIGSTVGLECCSVFCVIGVSMTAGQMQFTRMFFGPHSMASARDSERKPPFEAE